MDRRVAWSRPALADLDEATAYIARDSKIYAARFASEIRRAAKTLGRLAERGRIVPEISDASIRELIIGNYRLIYSIEESRTEILALIHGARELWRGMIRD